MNVFILNSGRCGSTTFVKACNHITNYTSAHESRLSSIGHRRLDYPDNHIEADNRLSWFLGRLDEAYGDNAFYVHLSRNQEDTITSFSKRRDFGIMKAYEQGILMHDEQIASAHDIADDYLETVNTNISLFLKNKTKTLNMSLETITSDFAVFWKKINATGDLQGAMEEWKKNYNSSG